MIITNKTEEISKHILNELGRGVTFLHGEGAYTGDDKKVIYCIITLNQLVKIKSIIFDIDPRAFVTIIDAAEVQGKGFKNTI
ncbi:YitT family protein [Caloramator sp. Dgby_cultured_2]|uniref:YitT family protein n=1 Tax=Caloramator sp. Dgby_cultured_2 TaxID=3029174 RepID=UPI00237D6171|nr:YitT family protein [Caloramator sp. Dgby_cultured_2]WDU84431.1 YitT family protein [Caloramator sp. Dgby_cultured_2]